MMSLIAIALFATQAAPAPAPAPAVAPATAASVGPATGAAPAVTAKFTLDTPIEALERALPLRVRAYGLRRGSGGAGEQPGGDGIWRELEALASTEVSLVTERRVSSPPGLAGGAPGAAGENWLLPGGAEARARRLPDKCTVHLEPGDVLRVLTPGGGGWGRPS